MRQFLSLLVCLSGISIARADYVIDFEGVSLPPAQYLPGANISGLAIESLSPFGVSYAVSRKRVLTNINAYWENGDDSVISGGGSQGSNQWLSAFSPGLGDLILVSPVNTVIASFDINNIALVAEAVTNGLFQASAFGPGDFLRVRFFGLDQNNQPSGMTSWIDLATHNGSLLILSNWSTVDLTALNSNRIGFEFQGSDTDPIFGLNTPTYLALDNICVETDAVPAAVVGSFAYHAGWTGSGSAIDTGKVLAKAGLGSQTLSFLNLINSSHGINGIGFDIQHLGNTVNLTATDFEFRWSPQNVFDQAVNPASGWAIAPSPTVSVSSLTETTSRIQLQWSSGQIVNRWVRITLKAGVNTGLAEDGVYYLGHLRGETDGIVSSGVYSVQFAAELSRIRAGLATNVAASSHIDIDKNGAVQVADIIAMRANIAAQLTNLTIP